jgi:DNA primase
MSKKGNEVHYGPSLRKRDLGKKRSGGDNVHSSSTLFVDIDPPDKVAPAEEQKAESKKLLDKFLLKLKEYGLEPTFIVESGHGFHVYFVFKTAIKQPSKNWDEMQRAMKELK